MKKISFVLILALAIACSKKATTPTQSETKATPITEQKEAISEIDRGHKLYEEHCNSCHGLKKIENYTKEEWASIVPRMTKMTNKKAGKELIDANAQAAILSYVTNTGK